MGGHRKNKLAPKTEEQKRQELIASLPKEPQHMTDDMSIDDFIDSTEQGKSNINGLKEEEYKIEIEELKSKNSSLEKELQQVKSENEKLKAKEQHNEDPILLEKIINLNNEINKLSIENTNFKLENEELKLEIKNLQSKVDTQFAYTKIKSAAKIRNALNGYQDWC